MKTLEHPAYKSLSELKQAVEAVYYMATVTPDDDEDKAAKSVIASRLKSDFDVHYMNVVQALSKLCD